MKPGIPWSVKGIEQQAREAAKQAARQSGMTIGEWLNSVILDSAEGGDDLERRYRRSPYRSKPLPGAPVPGAEHGEGEGDEATLRLEAIAEQLHTIARHENDTALSHHTTPEDEERLRAIVERLDAHEQHTTSAFGALQERLDEVSQRLAHQPVEAGHVAAQAAEDVPGYRALEGALRNIIEHIEISETRTRDTIRSLQERLAGADTAQPNDLGEVGEAEQRLRSLVEEAKQIGGAVSERDIDQLRLEIEQLATTVSQASGHAVSDLGGRVEQLEADLRSQVSERDQETRREVAALSDRIAATEKRLEHLATIEESVARLTRSLESDGGSAEARAPGGSPELKALEDGLQAVRASAEISDQRTQDTLQAVHETLEHIIGKLAELESGSDDDEQPTADFAGELENEPDTESAREFESDSGDGAVNEPEALAADLAEGHPASSELDPQGAAAPEEEAGDHTQMESGPEGFVFPEATSQDTEPQPHDAPQTEVPDTAGEAPEAAVDMGSPVREDYIAAARRAAQMAAMQRQNPVTTGFNKFSRRLSGGGSKPDEAGAASAPRRGFASTLFAGVLGRKPKAKTSGETVVAADGGDATGHASAPGSKKSKRKRLIFAGLVLLVAASAYGAQRQFGSLPGLDLLGGAFAPETTPAGAQPANAEPRDRTGLAPRDGLTTASIAPVSSPAPMARGTTVSLPAAIGPDSLRQAAANGNAHAQFIVAGRYLEGKAVPRDEEQAAQWYARAARQGLAAAQYRLGSMYEHGRGRPLDRSEAKVWYERAAERGNVNAMHNLAVLHTGSGSGEPQYELAAKWFQKAAERGLKDSQYNLAVLNEKGLGMVRNPGDAVFWYSLAAVQGDREARAKAKALEASLGQDAARQVHARLLAWRALPADRNANVVPLSDPSWQELS